MQFLESGIFSGVSTSVRYKSSHTILDTLLNI